MSDAGFDLASINQNNEFEEEEEEPSNGRLM
jgi:hypothetical protein